MTQNQAPIPLPGRGQLVNNPPFPALRSGPTAIPGASRQKQIPSSFIGYEGIFNYSASTPQFQYASEFALSHPGLEGSADGNGNGRSNFVDYALGEDPLGSSTAPAMEWHAGSLLVRQRVHAADVGFTLQVASDLSDWQPLEEGTHYTVVSEEVDFPQRERTLELTPVAGRARFFRMKVEQLGEGGVGESSGQAVR